MLGSVGASGVFKRDFDGDGNTRRHRVAEYFSVLIIWDKHVRSKFVRSRQQFLDTNPVKTSKVHLETVMKSV